MPRFPVGEDNSRRKGRRGRTAEPGTRRGINLLHGPGVGERFFTPGRVGSGADGSFGVKELVVEGFESGDGATDGEAGELGAICRENETDQSWYSKLGLD